MTITTENILETADLEASIRFHPDFLTPQKQGIISQGSRPAVLKPLTHTPPAYGCSFLLSPSVTTRCVKALLVC